MGCVGGPDYSPDSQSRVGEWTIRVCVLSVQGEPEAPLQAVDREYAALHLSHALLGDFACLVQDTRVQ